MSKDKNVVFLILLVIQHEAQHHPIYISPPKDIFIDVGENH